MRPLPAIVAVLFLVSVWPWPADAQTSCGSGTVPGVVFDAPFDFTGPGRAMPRHTRSADTLRTWGWTCDDPDDGFPLSLRCEVWDTCRVGGPCSSNISVGNPAVTRLVDGDCGTAASDPAATTFDYEVPVASYLSGHRYFHTARCVDSTGNTCTVSYPFWYDTEAPVAALDEAIDPPPPPDGGSTAETAAHLGFTCTDNSKDFDFFGGPAAIATAECLLYRDGALVSTDACGGGPLAVDGSETGTIDYADLLPGDYRFEVRCTDAAIDFDANGDVNAGNTGEPAVREWTVESGGAPLSRYLLFKVRATKVDGNALPKDFNLQLDDVLLPPGEPDDPENFTALVAKGIALPDGEGASYVVYQIKNAKEGVGGPLSNGKFPKSVKHVKRRVEAVNALGDIVLSTKKARLLWVPLATTPTPLVASDESHFLCYDVKAAADVTAQTPDRGKGKGVFPKGFQAVSGDDFSLTDCALDRDGNPSFPGSSAAGRCLYDLKKPKLLCHPVATSNVEPPRITSASITDSSPEGSEALLCYLAKLAPKVLSDDGADATGLPTGTKVRQRKHEKRSGLAIAPGAGFPAPFAVDTKKSDLLCLPTVVSALTPE